MGGTLDPNVLRWAAKCGRLLAAGTISPHEYAAGLLDHLSAAPDLNTHFAGEVAHLVPLAARPAMIAAVRDALRPEFRRAAFHAAPDGRTDAEREVEAAFITARVRAWAAALAPELGVGQAAEPSRAPDCGGRG